MIPLPIRPIPLLALLCAILAGCTASQQSPAERAAAAQALFDHTTRHFHVPAASATGGERVRLEGEARRGYTQLLRRYPEQGVWAAQALRSLGNLEAARTNITEAVKSYGAVAEKYPEQDWEVLMSLKSAADLLWEHGRRAEAVRYYRRLITRFDQPEAPPIVRLAVRGSQARLAEAGDSSR